MQILMIGTGYVGLVTGACFSEMGHTVTCLDIDVDKIDKLLRGIVPIYEPGLEDLVQKNISEGRLKFTTDYAVGIASSLVCFISVPTPSYPDGSCNLSYVETAARAIAGCMTEYRIIVNKSTVPIGTADRVKEVMSEEFKNRNIDLPFDVLSNPEFLKEGAAVQDCLRPDRVVIGSNNPKAARYLQEIYAPFSLSPDRIILMDTRSAEMTKYASNAMLATRISFMNEMADICKKIGANINEVRRGIGSDSRIGSRFLNPGIGYGGSCFPKDIRALISIAKQAGSQPLLLESVDEINNRQKKILGQKIAQYFSKRGGIKNKTIAIWGLSFKPETDDMREAPSLSLIETLLEQGVCLRLFDPVAMPNARKIINHDRAGIVWCSDPADAAKGADAVALVTEWKEFCLIDFAPIREQMRGAVIFDGRNQLDPHEITKNGFDYISIGAPDQLA